ncbi:MAG: adenylate kinase [Pseudomonadota bacterium]
MADGPRIAIIGNAGGGKSTLARDLSKALQTPHVELDRILWNMDWTPQPADAYSEQHARAIAADAWIIDGFGRMDSIASRLRRTTAIILVDMPLWMHVWLATERQIAWHRDAIDHPPAGAAVPPPTEALIQTIFHVDHEWMPAIRTMVDEEECRGKPVLRIESVERLRHGLDTEDIAHLSNAR